MSRLRLIMQSAVLDWIALDNRMHLGSFPTMRQNIGLFQIDTGDAIAIEPSTISMLACCKHPILTSAPLINSASAVQLTCESKHKWAPIPNNNLNKPGTQSNSHRAPIGFYYRNYKMICTTLRGVGEGGGWGVGHTHTHTKKAHNTMKKHISIA